MTYEKLKDLVKYTRKLQTVDDSDVFWGITGRKGAGKTSFSTQFSREYVSEYFGEEYFNLKKYFCYNNKHVEEKLHTLQEYAPIIGDEAIRFAWSREWNKTDSKDLIKFSTQIREKHHIVFLNIPRMAWIDRAYREGLLTMWAWIHATIEDGEKKSYAIIFEPDENQGEPDSWHLKELRQTEGKIKRIGKFTDIDQMYKIVKDHPCFFDIVQFPKVPDEIYKPYKQLKQFYAMEKSMDYVDQRDFAKIFCYNLKMRWPAFKNAIDTSRLKKPTYRLIADWLSFDPSRGKAMTQHTTIKNWIDEVILKNPHIQNPEELIQAGQKEIGEAHEPSNAEVRS